MEVERDLNNTITSKAISETKPTHQSLSSQFWGIDWAKELAIYDSNNQNNDLKVKYSSSQDSLSFLAKHFKNELHKTINYKESEVTALNKKKFYENFSDFFLVFSESGEPISTMFGNALDWSTYYIRFCATLPQYRRLGAQSIVVDRLKHVLSNFGVERICFDFNPTNKSQINYLNHAGFNLTGNMQTDRWGQVIQTTMFLNPESEKRFREKFGTDFVSTYSA
ncbi:MAG: GNAT family N-acetyltransferase [Xanthomonadaceae bacterium]|nr:GNAT family N-acetyltransferase [Xanthomonadaceae bacterium]